MQATKSGKCESIMEVSSDEPDHLPIVDFTPDTKDPGKFTDFKATVEFPSKAPRKTEISGFRTGNLCFR